MFDDARARLLLREVSIWMNGYCTALGDDAPFGADHLLAFIAADGALHKRILDKQELVFRQTEYPNQPEDDNEQDDTASPPHE